jgi:hypothetical protein
MSHPVNDGTVALDLLTEQAREAFSAASPDPALADALLAERELANGYGFVILDRGRPVGTGYLRQVGDDVAREVGCWVNPASRRQGYAGFAVRLMLEFAFVNLRLDRVETVLADSPGCLELFRGSGFVVQKGIASLTRAQWLEARDGPNLAALHPALRSLLDRELAAGNEVQETGRGWPDKDSVFVRLRHPFRAAPVSPPAGVVFREINDPHWWLAEFATEAPRHLLVC